MFEFKIEYYGNNYKACNSDSTYVRGYVYFIELYFGDIGFVYLAVMCGIGMSAYVFMLFLTNAISVKEVRKILKG